MAQRVNLRFSARLEHIHLLLRLLDADSAAVAITRSRIVARGGGAWHCCCWHCSLSDWTDRPIAGVVIVTKRIHACMRFFVESANVCAF